MYGFDEVVYSNWNCVRIMDLHARLWEDSDLHTFGDIIPPLHSFRIPKQIYNTL